MADDSVWWGRAQMGWRPEGYVLQVEHSLMERATLLMERMLQEDLERDGLAVTVTPMRQFHTANSSSADLGRSR